MLFPLLPLALSLACATAPPVFHSEPVQPVEQGKPIPAGDDKASAIEFRKFLLKLPEDLVIGTVQTGNACAGLGPLTWKVSRDRSIGQDFGALLIEELSSAGYPIAGDRDALFEDPHERRADYVIAGVVRDIRANVCYSNPKKELATAEASLTIDWQIYSHRSRGVEMKITTEGSSLLPPQAEPGGEAISRAFISATRNLLADDKFHDLLSGADAEAAGKPREPITVAYETMPVAARHPKSVESVVSDSRMAVVTLFAGDAMGSGFLISRDGYLLTDEHVVGQTRYVRVKFVTGREANGEVVRSDRRRDVALVKLEGDVYPYLPLGESSRVQPGADVFAIGTPLEENFGQTVTKGILSGYGEDDGLRILRSDVSIQKGNSGGPLLDRSGIVVGLSVSAYTMLPEGLGIGLNGFIPIEEALHALTIQRRAKP
ncbi:MAG: trypsin-like peptidase domain-containing protein [Acidobacteriota bacterium]